MPNPRKAKNCGWCGKPIPTTMRPTAKFCTQLCRMYKNKYGKKAGPAYAKALRRDRRAMIKRPKALIV